MTVNRYRDGAFDTVNHIDAGDGTEASVKVYRGDTDTWEEIWPVETTSLTQPVGDPIHWWPMDEGSGSTVRDHIASDDGTNNGATWVDGEWIGDAALEGDGSSAYVDTDDNAGLSGAFAVALTFVHPYTDGIVDSDGYLASAGFDGTNTSWELRFDAGNDALEILSWDGATHYTGVPAADISANEPHRFVGQYDADAGEWQIWIDGTLMSSTADSTGAVPSSASRYFFAHDDNGITERYFPGTLDDIALYDRALTDQEISDDFDRRPWTNDGGGGGGGGDTFDRPWTTDTNANPYDDNLTYNYVGPQPLDHSFSHIGYDDRPTSDDADIVATTTSELYSAFDTVSQGEMIWVEPGDYDISGQPRRQDLPADATLASDGARLYDSTGMDGVLELTNDGARVTGIRLEGDQETGSDTEQTIAILARADVEIDNCEIYWWQTAGIYVGWPDSNNPFVEPRIRHNIIRDCRTDRYGYGVVTYYQTDPLIEYNYINNCREGIASNGNDTASYRAENNLHGPDATFFAFECHEPGGVRMRIHDNEIQLVERNDGNMGRAYAQRGTPTDVADLQYNWFHNPNPPDPNDSTAAGTAISQTNHAASPEWENVTWSNNHYGDTEPSDASIGIDPLAYGDPTDATIDSYERSSLEYYSGRTAGDTDFFETIEDGSTEGTHSLYTNGESWEGVIAAEGGGLPAYPEDGDIIPIDFYGRGGFGFEFNIAYADTSNRFGVVVMHDETYSTHRVDGTANDLNGPEAVTTPADEWCTLEIEWVTRTEITYTVYDSTGTELYSGGGQLDAEAEETGQFAIVAANDAGGEVWLDYLRTGDGDGTRDPTPPSEDTSPTGQDDYDSQGNPIPNADAPWGYYDHDVANENWTLAAADDFDGTLSDSNWGIGFGWGRSHGRTEEYCRDQDVWVDSNTNRLVLQTLPDGDGGWWGGAAHTLNSVEGHHGYWEASINMPEPIDSFIPGFWTRGAEDLSGSSGWPPEVDFMERFGWSDGYRYDGTVHYNSGDDEQSVDHSDDELLSSNFNVFGAHWTDSYIDFYFNGTHIGRTTEGHGTWDYRLESQIHYALFTMHVWIADWNGDDPDMTVDYPVFTEMDWFRFWHF